MRKVLGIASVFIMMLSVAAFANTFDVPDSVLAASAVDVEECGEVALTYNLNSLSLGDNLDTPDGNVESVDVKGGDNCRYDDQRGDANLLSEPTIEVQLYEIDESIANVIDSGDAPFTGGAEDVTTVTMDGGSTKVTAVDGVNIRIYDRDFN